MCQIVLHTYTLKCTHTHTHSLSYLNPLNAKLNLICHLLALLGAHHILHISRIRVKCLQPAIFHILQQSAHLSQPYSMSCTMHKHQIHQLLQCIGWNSQAPSCNWNTQKTYIYTSSTQFAKHQHISEGGSALHGPHILRSIIFVLHLMTDACVLVTKTRQCKNEEAQ